MNVTEQTLSDYYTASIQKKDAEKKHRPLLIATMNNGERELKLVDDRSELSIAKRIQAYFGFGEASLSNVAALIREKKGEINVEKCRQPLEMLDAKIAERNGRSHIQNIASILTTKSLTIHNILCNAVVSTTYHPTNSTPEADAKGILDFAMVFPRLGVGYVADGTGHGQPEKQENFKGFWNSFNSKLESQWSQIALCNGEEEIEAFLKRLFLEISNDAEAKSTPSTLSFAALLKRDGRSYVASMHVGDSTLIHVHNNGEVDIITPTAKGGANDLELSRLGTNSPIYFDMREVQPGDKIYGVTDGITDFLSADTLKTILTDPNMTSRTVLERLKQAMLVESGALKKYDASNPNNSDDIGLFVLTVPSDMRAHTSA